MDQVFLLKKMRVLAVEGTARYYLDAGDFPLAVDQFLGKTIRISATGRKVCNGCQQDVPSLFRMGYCTPCFYSHPAAGASLVSPEKSTAHLGIEDRNLEYEKALQLQPHVVYLAHTGAVKVGVTRAHQKETRWLDQGADEALVVAVTTNRYEAGLLEVHLKQFFPDKTQWQSMVTGKRAPSLHWPDERQKALQTFAPEWQPWVQPDAQPWNVHYPVLHYPQKATARGLDRTPSWEAKLTGIRGQYLLFDDQSVFNVRGHEGHEVRMQLA